MAKFNKGDRVVYKGSMRPETGTVTRNNSHYYFVLFDGQTQPKACSIKDLKAAPRMAPDIVNAGTGTVPRW